MCTLKAGPRGGRKKCRAVICGNMLDQETDPCPNSYASGADGLLIRTTVRHGVQQGWGITTTDVKTAFLLAPRPRVEGTREVIVLPPKVMIQAGVCHPNERWRVHRALYGFPSSPARWSLHRDATMKGFQWAEDSSVFTLQQTPEGNLWKIWESVSGGHAVCVGHVLVYVDDVMVISRDDVRQGFITRLKQEWAVATPETVNTETWVHFCGLEFRWDESGRLHVAQPSYTKDLLGRHQVTQVRSCPMPKCEVPVEPEEGVTGLEIKSAQAVTGELLWLSVRSRPDISFAISLMGRHVSKNPRWVVKVGKWVLEYLASTPNRGLVYEACKRDRGPDDNLPIIRHPELIEAYADISFAPQGGRSCQGIIIMYAGGVVQWEASRQPFCAMSTAESELLGYCETLQVVQALESLLVVLDGSDTFEKLLCGDNSSAIAILTKPDGPWRTRHLRLRSHVLKEKLMDSKGDWKIRHQRGTELIADFLTKPITVPSEWERFARCVGMSLDSLDAEVPPPVVSKELETKESLRKGQVEAQQDDLCRVARLGVVVAAIGRAAECAGDTLWIELRRLAAVLLAVWYALARAVCLDVDQELRREVENTSKANEQQEPWARRNCQEAREKNEPAQGSRLRVENEPGRLDMLREDEPSISVGSGDEKIKGILKSSPVETPKGPVVGDGRRVWFGDEVVVAGVESEQASPASSQNLDRSRKSALHHHCPSGCPSSVQVSGAGSGAMDGCLRLAALRSGPSSDGHGPHGSSMSEVWNTAAFRNPPLVKKDGWEVAYLERGWLVRSHGERRVRRFHPVHRGVPIDVSSLEGTRLTIGFDERGERTIVRDLWTDPPSNLYSPKKIWVGWTLLKVREKVYSADGSSGCRDLPLNQSPSVVEDSGPSSSAEVMTQVCISGVEVTFGEGNNKSTGDVKGSKGKGSRLVDSTLPEMAPHVAGYHASSVAEKGRFVTSQLPVPATVMTTSVSQLSDDGDWEKVEDDEDSW